MEIFAPEYVTLPIFVEAHPAESGKRIPRKMIRSVRPVPDMIQLSDAGNIKLWLAKKDVKKPEKIYSFFPCSYDTLFF